jgi:D-alanyl-D-alanine dipeptidase
MKTTKKVNAVKPVCNDLSEQQDKATPRLFASDIQAVLNNAAARLEKGIKDTEMADACWQKARDITRLQAEHTALRAVAENDRRLYQAVQNVITYMQTPSNKRGDVRDVLHPLCECRFNSGEALAALASVRQ